MEKKNNLYYISCLRVIAMAMVFIPHILIYIVENDAMRYLRYYILNPMHIINGMGSMGVCIFFLISGFLSAPSVGKGNRFARLFKSVAAVFISVFAATVFNFLFHTVMKQVFVKYGCMDTVFLKYVWQDYFESALLLRSFWYQEPVDGVVWFLVPFLMFKILLPALDLLFKGDKEKCLYGFWGIAIFLSFAADSDVFYYFLLDRCFFILVILIGYIFSLRQELCVKKFVIYLFINGALMLYCHHQSWHTPDDGYIVSALYAVVLFYIFMKLKDVLKPRKFVLVGQEIGMTFFLLHYSVGSCLLALFYNILFPEHPYLSLILTTIADFAIILIYHYTIQKALNFGISKITKRITEFSSKKAENEMSKTRENNFDIIRLLAAIMVMSGHMSYICGGTPLSLLGIPIQSLGVYIFFLIGGYLIYHSWSADPHPLRYAIKRFFRIWPPLAVFCVFAAIFAGPLITDISVREYFTNPGTRYYFKNLLFYPIYSLPGVFAANPYPNAVNGSLWTLPVEAALYILIPISVVLIRKIAKDKFYLVWAILAAAVCGLQIVHMQAFPTWRFVIWGTDIAQTLAIIPYYFIGVLYTNPKMKEKLNLQIAVVLMLTMALWKFGFASGLLAQYIVIPYVIFSFALAPQPRFANILSKWECSYGLYLYGFFIQQLVTRAFVRMNVLLYEPFVLALSIVITLVLAMLSFRFVEKPCIDLSKKLLQRIPGKEKANA